MAFGQIRDGALQGGGSKLSLGKWCSEVSGSGFRKCLLEVKCVVSGVVKIETVSKKRMISLSFAIEFSL